MKIKHEYDETSTRLIEQLTKVLRTYDTEFIDTYYKAGVPPHRIKQLLFEDKTRDAIVADIANVYATSTPTITMVLDKGESFVRGKLLTK